VKILATIHAGRVRYLNMDADPQLAETLAPFVV